MSREAHTAVRANVRVHLTNPDSGYKSETTGKVTAEEWAVIDAILCGRGTVYPAAPVLLEACKQAEAQFADLAAITINGEHDARDQAAIEALRAAIQSATGEG